jgi:hypothetical protein
VPALPGAVPALPARLPAQIVVPAGTTMLLPLVATPYTREQCLMAYLARLCWCNFDGSFGNYFTLQGHEAAARGYQQQRQAAVDGAVPLVPSAILNVTQFSLRQRLKIVEGANRPFNFDDDTITRADADALQTVLMLFDIFTNMLRGPDGHLYLVLESVDTAVQLRAIRAAAPAELVLVPRGPCRIQDAYIGGASPLLLETFRAFRIPHTNVCNPVGGGFLTIPVISAGEFTATCARFGLTYTVPAQPTPEELAVAAGNPARTFIRAFRPSGPVVAYANATAILLDIGAAFDILERLGAQRALN